MMSWDTRETARSWTILQHAGCEGPGLIAREAMRRGLQFSIRHLDRGEPVPDPDEVEALIVMGGPMAVYESRSYPFLTQEVRLIEDLLRRRQPVLGICLGCQLLAHALGARVYPGDSPEIGIGFVELTEDGKCDPVIGTTGLSLPVFHWHGDTFDLPQGSTLLASSATYPHQAFRHGDSVYGLQFHIGPDQETWSAWRAHLPDGLLKGTDLKRHVIAQRGKEVIRNFFEIALGKDSERTRGSQNLRTR
jgi:GMP synthase (glutamine-hydrolysing)